MKIALVSLSFTTSYTTTSHFLSLGYIHAHAVTDELIGANTEIVHDYYDTSSNSAEEIAEAIAAQRPDLVGFSCYVWNTHDILKICVILKRILPAVRILLGGPEVSYHHLDVLDKNPSVDWIAVGEGEWTFRELVRALLQDDDAGLSRIAGLCQRNNGKAHLPAKRPYEKDLDQFASPYLTGVMDVCAMRGGVSYQTARGCPFVCTYCDYGRNQPYFEFSMDRVRKEFEFFSANDARILFNVDPTFNYNAKRAEAILDLGIEFEMKAAHWFEVFPTLVNQDLIDLIDKSHLCFIGCGIQSCTPETMRNIRRVWRPEKVAPMLDKLKYRKNVILSYEIIMGLPGDGVEEYKNTVSWTYEREPSDIKSFNLAILPRTPLENQVDQWEIEFDEKMGHEITKTKFMSPQDVLVGRAINEWHKIMQAQFFRLMQFIKRPVGQLIEDWGYRIYHAGYHDRIADIVRHDLRAELVEPLAAQWKGFVAEECAQAGIPDVSEMFRENLRYHMYRRARTWPGAFFADVRDIYFNEPYPELHRYFRACRKDVAAAEPADGAMVPGLGGDVDWHTFNYDMHTLFPRMSAAEMRSLPLSPTEYVFFMTPDTGAGCGIIVDDVSRRFLELVDGETSLADIDRELVAEQGPGVAGLALKLGRVLQDTGVFTRPTFLSRYEEGKCSWQSEYPETFRQFH